MGSIWADLLSLHGYPVHRREDLAWRDDDTPCRPRDHTHGDPAAAARAPTVAPKRRRLPWPRLAAPH